MDMSCFDVHELSTRDKDYALKVEPYRSPVVIPLIVERLVDG